MLVTIAITTYDRISLLEDTIHAVLRQTFSDFKIIIANDNPKRILSFDNLKIPEDPRIEIVNHKVNLGEIENLNWLMNKANTPYFTWLADDDILHPKFPGVSSAFFKFFHDSNLCCFLITLVDLQVI